MVMDFEIMASGLVLVKAKTKLKPYGFGLKSKHSRPSTKTKDES